MKPSSTRRAGSDLVGMVSRFTPLPGSAISSDNRHRMRQTLYLSNKVAAWSRRQLSARVPSRCPDLVFGRCRLNGRFRPGELQAQGVKRMAHSRAFLLRSPLVFPYGWATNRTTWPARSGVRGRPASVRLGSCRRQSTQDEGGLRAGRTSTVVLPRGTWRSLVGSSATTFTAT
jgi:hypothetical protein